MQFIYFIIFSNTHKEMKITLYFTTHLSALLNLKKAIELEA